ncbi:FAD-dependent oxidoreductase [Albimonas sp. CAU 1670]|uniref:NAD(P)/FAD-dependent oxidoreductase n=1 Tax=Albimonas sp. CAU 1670 TaxID=3032599 RepID=UPI0023DC7C73|nr:FAD-dependent oxidoreductase [Albimonas sp. CAU 1670]MDF2233285.1 FAD-dependent oxidoreductase [Albimonas sp. CAU 1670]
MNRSEGIDVLVAGGGAFGLWTALACLRRGLRVAVADAGRIGTSGASATPTGALAPHQPGKPTPLKTLQARALAGLPEALATLEAETGRHVGHARHGRLTVLPDAPARERAEARLPGMRAAMGEACAVLSPGDWAAEWLEAPAALFDPLTGRIDGARLLLALRAACEARGARMLDGEALADPAPRPEGFALTSGPLRAGRLALATGAAAFGAAGLPGGPEHGQAARLAFRAPEGAPVLMARGLWVVPHADGTVGVGATAEKGRADLGVDAQLDDVIARARALCPALRTAPVLSRWAGLRPRAASRDPVVGPLPDRPGVVVAGGGQRLGLALAAACGEAAAGFLADDPPQDWAEAFLPAAHLARA